MDYVNPDFRCQCSKPVLTVEDVADGLQFGGTINHPLTDAVSHPAHYNSGQIEVLEGIEDWDLGFHLGNSVKYIARAGKKDPAKLIEDLEKAAWYLARKIELLKASAESRTPLRPNQMVKK